MMTDDLPVAITTTDLSIVPAVDLAVPAPQSSALSPPPSVLIPQSPAAVYLASLSGESRRTMRTALNTIAGLLGVGVHLDTEGRDMRLLTVPWASLRYQHTAAIRAQLQERYAPATANKLLAALRRVLKEARRLGQMTADDYDRAVDVGSVSGTRLPRGRLVTDAEVAALMRICADDVTPAGARDAAIIATLRGTGLRRAEVVGLDLADYELTTGAITVRAGKGQKDRIVYAPRGARAAIDEWIVIRGNAPGPQFYGVVKGGALVVRRLAAQGVAVICAARANEAAIAAFTPHDMRRTFISGLLDAGADMATVQRLAGHEDPATTSRYDRRGEVAKQRASELVHVPHYVRNIQEV
jgi:integrase/recombinase XerD